ncbi:DUF7668 domain-containing protein [Pseudomonas yamanorum]|uniref:DUF7668 domain-containing protein n=1 Tax=Pseudomonas yamanorum TaxID=515393 RepID=UPI003F74FA2D
MKINKDLGLEIRYLIEALVAKDFSEISQRQWFGRLKKSNIEERMAEYGVKLTNPPVSFLEKADIYEYTDRSGIAIDIPLWSEEEGMSDLTLSLEVLYDGPKKTLQMTDLRTL